MATAVPEAPTTTINATAPTTTTGELALPITSGDMLGRLTLASSVAPAQHSRHHAVTHRRETFRPPRRDIVLMWAATVALTVTALVIAIAIIAG
ncbi:hypothetical protein [Naasia sp. SYSU D00948]|uniref:hypothetical protein n=1 Tax=Naasia sp. SYSU D00948 TaxID=2817379 RepID=UPI001B30F5F3|nr:hypothetical protein [Naasia sp. SYSU D00948]